MDGQHSHSHLSDIPQDVKLPLDQSERIIINQRTNSYLFLSVADDPIRFGSPPYDNFSSYSDVQIFAESISLTGDVLSEHGITFSCNDIIVTSPTRITTTGANGADQVMGGSDAERGAHGGAINFYVQSGTTNVSKHLTFVTNGGKGGDAVVMGARAGDGGDGGGSIRIFQSCYSVLLGSIYSFLNLEDAGEGNFGSPVRRKDPIYVAASQLLTVALKAGVTEEKVAEHVRAFRALLDDIAKGKACLVKDLVVNVRFIRNTLEDLQDEQNDDFRVNVSFKGGYPGTGKGVPAVTGEYGKDGSDSSLYLSTYDQTTSLRRTARTFEYAHPEQCNMLLVRAKVYYYMDSPQLRLQAEALFQRLVNRLNFIPANQSSVMSSDSLSKLRSIKTEASNWLAQLATGKV
jgi:hypothetical protein